MQEWFKEYLGWVHDPATVVWQLFLILAILGVGSRIEATNRILRDIADKLDKLRRED